MKVFRRRRGSDVWHFCRDCPNWPRIDYEEQYTKPATGRLDPECEARKAAGTCTA